MTEFWYRDNCPICGPDGELVIAQDADQRLALVCAECGIGFLSDADCTDPVKAVDMLGRGLRPATEAQIDAAGWRHLCRRRVSASFPF